MLALSLVLAIKLTSIIALSLVFVDSALALLVASQYAHSQYAHIPVVHPPGA